MITNLSVGYSRKLEQVTSSIRHEELLLFRKSTNCSRQLTLIIDLSAVGCTASEFCYVDR